MADKEDERVHRSGRRLGNIAVVLPPPWLKNMLHNDPPASVSDGKGLCGVWQLQSKWSQSCGVLAAAVVGSMFSSFEHSRRRDGRSLSGGSVGVLPKHALPKRW